MTSSQNVLTPVNVNLGWGLYDWSGLPVGGKVEPTTTTERGLPESPALWPTFTTAFLGAFIVGTAALDHWGTWDLYNKIMGVAIVISLVLAPTLELLRKSSGKDVRFANLATSAYTAVWITAVVFNHHAR